MPAHRARAVAGLPRTRLHGGSCASEAVWEMAQVSPRPRRLVGHPRARSRESKGKTAEGLNSQEPGGQGCKGRTGTGGGGLGKPVSSRPARGLRRLAPWLTEFGAVLRVSGSSAGAWLGMWQGASCTPRHLESPTQDLENFYGAVRARRGIVALAPLAEGHAARKRRPERRVEPAPPGIPEGPAGEPELSANLRWWGWIET